MTPEPSPQDLADNLAAVVDGLASAARRASTVTDQALDLARDTLRHLEHVEGGPGAVVRSPRVTALRGRFEEIAGRAATLTRLDEVTATLALLPAGLGLDGGDQTDNVTPSRVAALIGGCRFAYRDEAQLQQGIAQAVAAAGHPVQREVRLSARDRLDLLVGTVCVEVKIAGTVDRLLAQLLRYAEDDRVQSFVVVTNRARHRGLPQLVGGKPCTVVRLRGAA